MFCICILLIIMMIMFVTVSLNFDKILIEMIMFTCPFFTCPLIQLMRSCYQNVRLGSARAVNRRYICDCVPLKLRMQASAGFVSASALGMACGPALSCLLQTNFKISKLTFNEDTLPGWLMAVAWLVYLLWLWVSFREPSLATKDASVPEEANAGM